MLRPASRRTAKPLTPPQCSASFSTAWDGVTTGPLWGGEFLLADYRRYERLGTFRPVAMLGGAQAAREPWRNLYAHLVAEMGWAKFATNFSELDLYADLSGRPRTILDCDGA